MVEKQKRVIIQWSPKFIDIGVVRTGERVILQNKKTMAIKKTNKIHYYWVAYDLTQYHIGTGKSAGQALDRLGWQLWAEELLAAEEAQKGVRVIRERLIKRCPEARLDMKRDMKLGRGATLKRIEWRAFFHNPFLDNPQARKLMGIKA